MICAPTKSDGNFVADPFAALDLDDFSILRSSFDKTDIGEVFDAAARRRVGLFISAASSQSAKKRRGYSSLPGIGARHQ
jgi:hypothetical protein